MIVYKMTMLVRKAYQFRLDTSPAHEALARQYSGCQRFVWNKALAFQKELLDNKQRCLPYAKLTALLVQWKREHPFLALAPSQTLQQTLKFLDRALGDAFDPKSPKRFPVFKKKGTSRDSFRYPQGFEVKGSHVFLPKLGLVSFRKSRKIEGIPKNITVFRELDHWYIAVQVEIEVKLPVHTKPLSTAIGLDVGVNKLIAQSDGERIPPLNAFKKAEKRLAKLQRQLSKKVKFSSNWHKLVKKIQALHTHIANMRRDYLHKASTTISKRHAFVCMEDLRIVNMTASAKGTIEDPGKNVRQKAGLNKSILDQGWGELQRQLEYKQLWSGGMFVPVPPQYTSQRCSVCGHTEAGNRPSQAVFRCLACGYTGDADVNAAKNILSDGLALLLKEGILGEGLSPIACGEYGAVRPFREAGSAAQGGCTF
jgi:putative transposase